MNGGIKIESDLKLSFDQIGIRFVELMNDYKDELEKISKDTLDIFDFKTAIKHHIENKIHEGLEKAFKGIDLSDHFKSEIWKIIEKKIK